MEICIHDLWNEYELVDCGNGRKLERFGEITLIRPEITATGKFGCILGGRKSSGNNDFQITTYKASESHIGTIRNGQNAGQQQYNAKIKLNTVQHTSLINNVITYSDGTTQNTSDYTWTDPYNIYLFGLNDGGTFTQSGTGARIYNAKLLVGNNIVRDFVPVIRKSDNEPGMLDLANLSRNLFDRESQVANTQEGMHAGTPNAYLKDDGSEVSSSGWWITDFIGIYSDTVTISGVTNNTPSICLYDDNKSLLTCTRYSGNESITISASGAKYVRFSLIRNTNTSVMLNEGTEALPYEPYKKSFYTNDGTGEFIAGPEI